MAGLAPAYLKLFASGELERRVREAARRLEDCALCPRACHIDRTCGAVGVCQTGVLARVSSAQPHFGEEAPLVGRRGSGTIFFAYCNLHCQFCQNFELSALGQGRPTEPDAIARMMLSLQSAGCHNINFVSPSHVVPQMLAAIHSAAGRGLRVPIVYNTGGYDALETLALLDGVVDIYMPDMKYADEAIARMYSDAPDYPTVNQAAVSAMYRQVGDLELDECGVAIRGLLVRHLVLPERLAGTAAIAQFLAKKVSASTYINVMDQYRPCYRADALPPLDRRITRAEYEEAVATVCAAGLHRLDDRTARFLRLV